MKDGIELKAEEVDRACMALVTDLKQRGLLEDTLIVWAGEFGRTPMSQGRRPGPPQQGLLDLAGRRRIKGGMAMGPPTNWAMRRWRRLHGPRPARDHADLLGIDHNRFTFKFQGLDARLSGVEGAEIIKGILA